MPGAYGLSAITPYSLDSIGEYLRGMSSVAPTSQAWIGANRGAFFPFVVAAPMTCKKVFWSNGATVAGTVDVGVYTPDQKLLVSAGPQTQAGASVIQEFDVTDTVIPQGLNYMAISCSSTTSTFVGRNLSSAEMIRAIGCYHQAAVSTLPATAAWVTTNNVLIPVFGILVGPVP